MDANPKNSIAKRIVCFILAFIMSAAVMVSCNPSNVDSTTEGTNTMTQTVSMWTAYGYDKLRIEMKPSGDSSNEHTLYLAKNESEGLHIGVRSDTDMKSLTIRTLSGDNDYISYSFFDVQQVLKLGRKQYTDRCMPIGQGTRLSLEKDKTMVIYVDFKTADNTPAGEYNYEFALLDKQKNVLSTVKVTLHVWDFAMPEERKFITSVCLHYDINRSNLERYEFLLDYGLSAYHLPYDILDDRADAYMSDPRVTSFTVLFGWENLDDAALIERYNKLKTNPVWFEKAYLYPIDEPDTVEELYEMQRRCEHLKSICPDLPICVPYYTNLEVTDDMDQIDFMDQYVDFHCPKLANWGDFENFGERMKAIQNKGEKVLAYVCNVPELPYLNLKVDEDGINHRIVLWQMYQRNVDGFSYWRADCWTDDPWHDVDYFGQGWYGDGILTYPRTELGSTDKLVPSIRLIILRDGLEDIELLYMAEELLGEEWAMERANKVSKSLTSVDVTSDEFASLRIEIGNAVEQALKNK